MSLDVAESLVVTGALDLEDLASRFAGNYRWSRGYGPSTSRVLKRVARGMHWRDANRTVHRDGSFGNGGAMRAPVVGLFYSNRRDDLAAAARLSASVTHAHPLGMEGAALVASATAFALLSLPPAEVLAAAASACTLGPFVARATQETCDPETAQRHRVRSHKIRLRRFRDRADWQHQQAPVRPLN